MHSILSPRARAVVLLAGGLTLTSCVASESPTAPVAPEARADVAAGALDPSASLMGRRLLRCPTSSSQMALAVLGPSGGELGLGNFRMTVPAGALAEPRLFSLTVKAGEHMAVDVHAVGLPSFRFERPVTVTIDYSRCGNVEGPLRAWYVDEATGALLEDMGGVTDPVRRTHTFQTPHLSIYAVAN